MIDAGKLDRQIQLLTRTREKNAYAQVVDSWTVVATVPAQRLELRQTDLRARQGSSDTQQMVRRSVQIGKYLIRWRSDVTANMRVRIDGTDYEITGLDEPDRRQTLTLTVEAV